MKAASPVLNGGDEETCGNATRLVPTQLGSMSGYLRPVVVLSSLATRRCSQAMGDCSSPSCLGLPMGSGSGSDCQPCSELWNRGSEHILDALNKHKFHLSTDVLRQLA